MSDNANTFDDKKEDTYRKSGLTYTRASIGGSSKMSQLQGKTKGGNNTTVISQRGTP